MPQHTVRDGDCITSIAYEYGLYWETIWEDSQNSQLRQQREDPNVLRPGDVVFVPGPGLREEVGETEQRHRFRRKGVPIKLRLRLTRQPEGEPAAAAAAPAPSEYPLPKDSTTADPEQGSTPQADEPRAKVRYVLKLDGQLIEGETDSEGRLEVSIPPGAVQGRLIIEPGTRNEEDIPLMLGYLNPITEVSGIKQRLENLGFACGTTDDEPSDALTSAICAFQEKHGLEVTGEMDDETRDQLEEAHGD